MPSAARTLKEPIMMIRSPAFEAPIHRRGGHYFVGFDCNTLRQGQAVDQILWSAIGARSDGEVNVAGVSRTLTQEQRAHVWAARLGGGERTIRGLVAATKGHGLKQTPCVTGSTCEAEGVASVKTAEKVACKQAPGARAKHALRRWHWLRQQISMGASA